MWIARYIWAQGTNSNDGNILWQESKDKHVWHS